MLFNSIQFIIFFVVVTSLYFIIPHKFRWLLLLLASCYFYMAFVPIYICILGFTIVVDYFAGIYIDRSAGRKRKWFLVASLVANIGVLAFFKYFNFFNQNITELLSRFGLPNHIPYLSILLPIGLSFHTFQAMSYTIEVYRGNQKPETHFGIYALYVMFYPQLVAGPIERPQNVLHQFYEKHEINYDDFSNGFRLILWGFFKKIVIADRLALFVNVVYRDAFMSNSSTLILATIYFAIQIYCDFSGYSDIALGTARIMGFKLMTNFNRPYFATSVSGFWRRWHISLTTWFTDYLYISMGGSRVSIPRWYFNLLFVFLVSGLWHGANWTFVIWGGLNGVYLIAAIMFRPVTNLYKDTVIHNKLLKYTWHLAKTIFTFILIGFSWIFFRANSLDHAFLIIRRIFTVHGKLSFNNDYTLLVYPFIGMLTLLIFEIDQERNHGVSSFFNNKSPVIRMASYCFVALIILLIGVYDGGQFIYFQF
ncbi:MAG TPA: MBOAT family O-acyltransferase [Mucilaginibacter sp.]|nr:MBOAT family O-acyltransferase [Mucilaginibacter sp.]